MTQVDSINKGWTVRVTNDVHNDQAPIGSEGIVFWTDHRKERLGFKDDKGRTYWANFSNVKVVTSKVKLLYTYSCKFCGVKELAWTEVGGRKKLVHKGGRYHRCKSKSGGSSNTSSRGPKSKRRFDGPVADDIPRQAINSTVQSSGADFLHIAESLDAAITYATEAPHDDRPVAAVTQSRNQSAPKKWSERAKKPKKHPMHDEIVNEMGDEEAKLLRVKLLKQREEIESLLNALDERDSRG